MEASNAADFYGFIPGHAVEIADAERHIFKPCWLAPRAGFASLQRLAPHLWVVVDVP